MGAKFVASLALFGAAIASQPDSVSPIPGPMRDLVWGQLNVIHTTDTHGWLAGHLSEHQYSGDWGDFLSFSEHMRKRAEDAGVDLLFVDTGDRVEGNGLYDASTPKGRYTYELFRQHNVDVICSGNHELYQFDTAAREFTVNAPNFGDRYVASNLDYVDPVSGDVIPFAQRFRRFKTKTRGLDVMAFGFLFDFDGNNNNTVVRRARDVVVEDWFKQAIQSDPDVFVVIGHVGLRMPEFRLIYSVIRAANPLTPIAIFGGHAHVRDTVVYDEKALAIASGRYFETVGWMSVDGIDGEEEIQFSRRYIDNNLLGYYHHTGLDADSFPTDNGRNISTFIYQARRELELDEKFGCAPADFWMSRAPYPSDASIYTFMETQLLPDIFSSAERGHIPRLAFFNTGGVRFDIFKGRFTRDSLLNICPFENSVMHIPDVPYEFASQVLDILNRADRIFSEDSVHDPLTIALNVPEAHGGTPNTPQGEPLLMHVQKPLRTGKLPTWSDDDLTYGYTTHDDFGSDGDDTVHRSARFYVHPNCIQASIGLSEESAPETVDLVFIDFLTPFILRALQISGKTYTREDVTFYRTESFSHLFQEWVEKNWNDGEC